MAADLVPISLRAPGFYGLNLQDSPIGMPAEYALVAKNCVIDKLGRVGARKGWAKLSAYSASIGTDPVTLIHEFIKADGTQVVLFIANGHLWSLNMSTGAVTDLYTGAWSSAGTLAGDEGWQAVTFNGAVYFFKLGQNPFIYNGTTTTLVSAAAGYAGTVQTANCVLSAYGRLWTANTTTDKVTFKWSDTLIGPAWTGGASGSASIESVLTGGTRAITALAAFNGFLIVFCDKAILIYQGADEDPSTNLNLVEVIDGVGCIARDSVQIVGDDILFLSETGVRSLGRVIDQKSAPFFDVSRNVRDQLMADVVSNADNNDIISGYSAVEGFYLLTLRNADKTYCFDLKNRLENSVCRVTTWDLVPYCYCYLNTLEFLMGFDGYVGEYSGYNDDAAVYNFEYVTSHLGGDEEQTLLFKILKHLRAVFIDGGGYSVLFSWGFDYQGLSRSEAKSLPASSPISEYNIAEFNIGEYGDPDNVITTMKKQLTGYGQTFQLGILVEMNGQALSLQQLDIFTKIGRLA